MKSSTLILILSLFIISCVRVKPTSNNRDSNSGNDSDSLVSLTTETTLKNEMIRNSLIKKGIFSYVRMDSLYIFNDNNIKIAACRLPSHGNKDFYNQLDTSYSIDQSKHDNLLVVTVRWPNTESDPSNFVILDMSTKKIVLNITASYTDSYIGSSYNVKYHAIEYGTSACGRGFHIYDSENNIVKESGYYSCVEDKNQLKWFGDKIFYYDDCDKDASLPKNLPKLKEQEIYVQKYYWTNGKDSITNEFSVAVVE